MKFRTCLPPCANPNGGRTALGFGPHLVRQDSSLRQENWFVLVGAQTHTGTIPVVDSPLRGTPTKGSYESRFTKIDYSCAAGGQSSLRGNSKHPRILNDGNHTGDLNRTEQASVKSCPIARGVGINSLKARCFVTSVGPPWECLQHRARTREYRRNLR